MGLPPDENLPEVVPDSSPQALSHNEANLSYQYLGERDPKYPVILDDSPKLLKVDDETASPAAAGAPFSPSTTAAGAAEPGSAVTGDPESPVDGAAGGEEQRICGLRKKTFFIVLVVVLVILAAAIGGGVGGGLAARNARASAEAAEAEAEQTPTPTSEDTSTDTSSSPTPTATFLNNQTSPDNEVQFQAFSGFNYTGEHSEIYAKEGWHDFGFMANSYVWKPGKEALWVCCVTFCVNETTAGGYRCTERYQPAASGPFGRLRIYCGEDPGEEKPCSLEEEQREKGRDDDDDE